MAQDSQSKTLFSQCFLEQKMKRFIKEIKGGIQGLDLFSSGSLLRVKGDSQHKTLLGGMISLSVMLLLLVTFYNRIIGTFNKVIISSSASDSNAYDPSVLNLTTVGKGSFMLGTEVFDHNLNVGSRYFDVVMTSYEQSFGVLTDSFETPLEPCTPDHWAGYPEIQAKFVPLNMGYWKCLPKDAQFEIQGKYSSEKYKSFSIQLRVCSNSSYDTRPCAPQAEIDQFFVDSGVNYLTVYFTNPLINPENQEYLTYYLEDTIYVAFSYDYGGEGLIYVDDYTISTDNSLLPISSILTQTGGIVTKPAAKNTYLRSKETYADFYFYKSSTSNSINRSYEKLDNVFSYIGGLFGTVLIFFFMVGSYNTYKFEVNLAGYLYRTERRKENSQGEIQQGQPEGSSPLKIEREYNFFYFLGQSVFQLLQMVGCKPKWARIKQYHRVREEMVKQLDVLFIIKRINFLEKSLSFLFTPPQLKALHLTHQPTMADAIATRHNYKLKHKLQKEIGRQKATVSNVSSSKNQVCGQLIIHHGNNTQKNSLQSNLPSDSNHYSSEESSSSSQEQGEAPLLSEMTELHKDRQSKISRRIWLGIDQRLRKMIKQTSTHQRLQDEVNKTRQNLFQFQSLRFETIQTNELVVNTPFQHSRGSLPNEMEDSLSDYAEVAKVRNSRLRTVKVERQERLIRDDISQVSQRCDDA